MVISNVAVYGLKESIKRAKYPKSVDISKLNSELTNGIKALSNSKKGEGHDNFLNGIIVQFDLTFTIKAWTEGERYHFLDFISSQSTMHKIAEFDIENQRLKNETLQRCFDLTQPWERTNAHPVATVMEGPTVIKKGGKYYLFYSANHFESPDYAVGFAVADTPYGPWRKSEKNPIIHRSNIQEPGSGHGDIFISNDGLLHYVYHIHYSTEQATPRRTRIIPLHSRETKNGEYEFFVNPQEIIIPVK
jgi:hypothetical protein